MNKFIALTLLAFGLAACGGGGGSSGTSGGGGSVPQPASVSGDMLAYQVNRGWNYQGNAFGVSAETVSLYADPQQSTANGTVEPFIMFRSDGTTPDAFAGTKLGGIGVQGSSSGYVIGSYVVLNADGTTYAQGGFSPLIQLVPSTLVQGQSFSTNYPGATATVLLVGNVPGASACPTPTQGATVQYSFMGQSYSVSYVPGCGITQYVGNTGEVLTLASIGSYPSLGTQSVRRMTNLTVFDSIRSLLGIIAHGQKWRTFVR